MAGLFSLSAEIKDADRIVALNGDSTMIRSAWIDDGREPDHTIIQVNRHYDPWDFSRDAAFHSTVHGPGIRHTRERVRCTPTERGLVLLALLGAAAMAMFEARLQRQNCMPWIPARRIAGAGLRRA